MRPKNMKNNRRLTVEQVVRLRAMRSSGMRLHQVAKAIGCSVAQVSRIDRRQQWGWLK